MSKTERVRVAVTVFAEVDHAVDRLDAGHIVTHLIRRFLTDGKQYEVVLQSGTRAVTVHDVMENGMAAGNGYLWTQPTGKAYTQYDWQHVGDERDDG